MRRFLPCLAVLCLAMAAGRPADAAYVPGHLPDGSYRCEVYMLGMFLTLGDIGIKGSVYQGPSFEGSLFSGRPQQGYNYQINPNGEITWLGPLGGFTSGGNSVVLTQVTDDGETTASFDIVMRHRDGAFTAATCTIRPHS